MRTNVSGPTGDQYFFHFKKVEETKLGNLNQFGI
jgi:hypothetical protein